MCGIGGTVNRRDLENHTQTAAVFRKYLHPRGPDHFGTWQHKDLLLSHSRLKIIDLSDDANQPMISRSGNSVLSFNGEIFNFKEIAKKNNLDRSTSDTGVLLESIEKIGLEATLKDCVGMFAFAYVDLKAKEIWLVRDRFGQKPLYYSADKGLTFSSDVGAIVELAAAKPEINRDALDYYFTELSVPQPLSIWNNICQLEPAQAICFNFKGEEKKRITYWTLPNTKLEMSLQDAIEETEKQLTRAIVDRTVSDVPYGCFLSGGIDSGLIVSILATQSSHPVKTFSVGFDYEDFNELADAKIIADKYQTKHTEIKLDIDIEKDIEKILGISSEPFADSSIIPTYYVSREIKQNVSVALSGDGGDELFGGYLDYGYAFGAEQLQKKYPGTVRRKAAANWSKLVSRINDKYPNLGTEEAYLKIEEPFQLYRSMGFDPRKKEAVPTTGYTKSHFTHLWNAEQSNSITEKLMRTSLKTRLLNDYLVKVDRASMGKALEVRSPFLDHRLAEFAFSVPNELKFNEGQLKFILKKLGEKYMYKDIFSRKKRGFGIPVKHWIRKELYTFAADHIQDLINRKDYVHPKAMELLRKHRSGEEDHTHRVWSLICLEIWLKKNT